MNVEKEREEKKGGNLWTYSKQLAVKEGQEKRLEKDRILLSGVEVRKGT